MSTQVLNQISFAKESAWGTAVTPTISMPVDFGGGIQTKNDIKFIEQLKAQLAKNSNSFIGARTHEGEYTMDLFGDYPPYWIYAALGSVSSALASGESIVYEHTISESESKPSFTIEQAIEDNVRRYAGCMVSGFKISGKVGETVKITPSFKGKSQASATKITAAYSTVRPYNFADIDIQIGGASIDEVDNFEIKYSNGLEVKHALNQSNDPAYTYVKSSEVKGKIEMYLDSTTSAFMTDYLAKTERQIEMILTGDSIGTAEQYGLDVDIPKAVFTIGETPLGNEFNLLTIEWEGIYDTTTSKLISAIATNLLSSI